MSAFGTKNVPVKDFWETRILQSSFSWVLFKQKTVTIVVVLLFSLLIIFGKFSSFNITDELI